jgi:phosphatidate cytidylyltransferase
LGAQVQKQAEMTPNTLFVILLFLFVLGGMAVFFVNRKKERNERQNSWIKYFVYFFIVNTLFASISYCPALFRIFCVMIVLGGSWELIRLQHRSHPPACNRFGLFFPVYLLTSVLFCLFSFGVQGILSFTLLMVCSFDAFSQLSGQWFGKRKICPQISPDKTIGGTVGGTIVSMMVSVIAGCHTGWGPGLASIMGLGIAGASFAGDLAASYVKRQFAVKDFGRTFPGHGGFLDRFDSLMLSGAFMYLFQLFCRQ